MVSLEWPPRGATYDAKDIGHWVHVDRKDGPPIEGWLYSRTAAGVLIASDPKGSDLRFVPSEQYGGMTVHFADAIGTAHGIAAFVPSDREQREQALATLNAALAGPFGQALARVDQNHVQRLSGRIGENWRTLASYQSGFDTTAIPADLVLNTRQTHVELLEELDASGVSSVLVQHEEQLHQAISVSMLPQLEGELADPQTIATLVQSAQEAPRLGPNHLGRVQLDRFSVATLLRMHERDANGLSASEPAAPPQPDPHRRRRWLTGWAQVLLGGAFATTDLTLGALAALLTALPTLGASTVPVYVTVAGSVYVGLSGATKALQDLPSSESPAQSPRPA